MTTYEAIEFQHLSLATGVRLHFADVGPRNGRPVLFLHGYSDSWFSFSPILSQMAPDLRLIIPDQRGHGDSERPSFGYTLDELAADAIALIEALDINSTCVVGHSLGSFVAQRMAILAPTCVSRLILVGTAASSKNDAVRTLAPAVQSLTDPVDLEFIRDFQLSTIYRPLAPGFLDRVIAESSKLPAVVWNAVLDGMLNPPEPFVGNFQCPVSVFWGDRDAIFSCSDQDELLSRVPLAPLHTFEGVGHAPHWEAPEEFAERLMTEINA